MSAGVATIGLGRRYGRDWVLSDVTLEVPAGSVVGIIGPNGAGKSTLMDVLVGLSRPDAGTLELFGEPLVHTPEQLARIGFTPQRSALYGFFSVTDHLRMGAALNPSWDAALADALIERLGLRRRRWAGRLSGGQQAQLALVLALAKRPDLLVLDEPVANLDPLARRECLAILMEYVADRGSTVLISSHLVDDLERICDHAVLLVSGRVALQGDVESLLSDHRRLSGPRRYGVRLPGDLQVIEEIHTDRQSTLVVRGEDPVLDPGWSVEAVGLEELALAYMRSDRAAELTRVWR